MNINRENKMKKPRIITEAERYFDDEDVVADNKNEVTINGLTWMTENLDDVRSVPLIEDKNEWVKAGKEGKPACCYYNNQRGKGVLYNWFALKHLEKGGWRVPTNKDWDTLPKGRIELDNLGWNPQYDGYRGNFGYFDNVGKDGSWWSATEDDALDAWGRDLNRYHEYLSRFSRDKRLGLSVRLVRG